MLSNFREYHRRYTAYLGSQNTQEDDEDDEVEEEEEDDRDEGEDDNENDNVERNGVRQNDNTILLNDNKSRPGNKRARYSRPCDGCSLKKVKCSGTSPCTRCINNGIPCTNNRIRKKCGPKPNKFKSTNNSNSNSSSRQSSTSSQFSKKPKTNLYSQPQLCSSCDKEMRISLSLIVPSLQIYQTWFYGVWPVISVPQLISNLTSVDFGFELSQETSVSYALCLAVSAAVSRQMTFLSEKSSLPQVPVNIDFESVAKEAIRIRDLYDHRLNPNCETLLTSFFLYVYYINIKDATATAIIYLREAISMAQILKLHDAKTYMRKPVAEAHRLKKIFYLLLITERFMCIEDNVPVILDACVPYPSLEEEEYPELLSGFIELVHIFSIPNRDFFEKMLEFNDDGGSGNSSDNYKMLHSFLHDASHSMSESQIIEVDSKLRNISLTHLASDIQKANILLSKSWMRSLTWHIAQKRGVLKRNFNDNDSCLSFNYPATIANDFLKSICGIPIYAFESNGPGVVVKLLEIASGLADSIQDLSSIKSSDDLQPCYNALSSIFSLICKFKTDTILPVKLYQNIERMVLSRSLSTASTTAKLTPIPILNVSSSILDPSPPGNEYSLWEIRQSRDRTVSPYNHNNNHFTNNMINNNSSPYSNKNMFKFSPDTSIIKPPILFHQDILALVDQTPTDFVTYQFSNTPPVIEELDKTD